AEVEKLRALVAAGAAPRNDLDRAEAKIADAEDEAFLRRTLYGTELTPQQADNMIAAAGRRLERRQQTLEAAGKLVKAQGAPATSPEAPSAEVELAKKEYALAESRAEVTREIAAMARAEEDIDAHPELRALTERFDGDGTFSAIQFGRIESAFQGKFGKPI